MRSAYTFGFVHAKESVGGCEVIERVDVEGGRMTVRPIPGLFERDEEPGAGGESASESAPGAAHEPEEAGESE